MPLSWLRGMSLVRPCWMVLSCTPDDTPEALQVVLQEQGFSPHIALDGRFVRKIEENWADAWGSIAPFMQDKPCQLSLCAGDVLPDSHEISALGMSLVEANYHAAQAWLPQMVEQEKLLCHFQSVVDARGEVFGYESLVRGQMPDGSLVNGGGIFAASRTLKIEHLMDRHLHELAIKAYTAQKMTGLLFINLVPGFIQRPEFYLSSLAEATRRYGMSPKQIVLDCTNSENPRDIEHMKAVFHYCRAQGYLLALDDISSAKTAERMLGKVRPDFIKIDMHLVQDIANPDAQRAISQIVEITHNYPCSVIAEGVETEAVHQRLKHMGIRLFQGYYFSTPEISPEAKEGIMKETDEGGVVGSCVG